MNDRNYSFAYFHTKVMLKVKKLFPLSILQNNISSSSHQSNQSKSNLYLWPRKIRIKHYALRYRSK